MATEVMLLANVPELGSEGDVVEVADGYARNYILPKKLGAPVTEASRRRLAKIREEREAENKARMADAKALAKKLEGVSCTVVVKVGEEEKMYGSVTANDVIAALKEQGFEIDRHALDMEHPVKELGVFDVKIRLHPDIESSVKVWVVEE